MRIRLSYPFALFAVISFLFALSIKAVAQESHSSSVTIKNFGQMDERFYRGARPKDEDYKLPQPQTTKPKAIASNERAAQI